MQELLGEGFKSIFPAGTNQQQNVMLKIEDMSTAALGVMKTRYGQQTLEIFHY